MSVFADLSCNRNTRAGWEQDTENNLYRFQLASLLACSPSVENRQEAVLHLSHLASSSGEFIRDALYLLSTTKYTLGDLAGARACAEELLRLDPDNVQVSSIVIVLVDVRVFYCIYE